MLKSAAKRVLPEALKRHLRRFTAWKWIRGDYYDWSEAMSASRGYDDPRVLDRIVAAAREVRSGRAAWDRDGVVFQEPQTHGPLLDALVSIARSNQGTLDLIDFGGGLGSTWWQHRRELKNFNITWRIVEQANVLEAGRAEFATDELLFFDSIAAAVAPTTSTILFSGVLHYLPGPFVLIHEALERKFSHVLIDRTGFTSHGHHRIAVQHVPPSIGAASYPCWLFDRSKFFERLLLDYEIVSEWPMNEIDNQHPFAGFHLRRKAGRAH